MGIETATAILIATGVGAGVSIYQSEQAKKSAKKSKPIISTDKKITTLKDKTKRNARTALVVGSPKGILDIEDGSATTGRGTILGN